MKNILVSRLMVIGLLALGAEVYAKDVKFKDLPPAVQREAQTELKSGSLKKIESVEHNGRNIYAFTFQRPDGSSKYIYLDANGTYVNDQNVAPSTASTVAQTRDVQLSQLPEAVQRTVQTETKNGPVARIQQMPQASGGGLMYQVTFNQPSGQEKIIYLNSDGTYVQNKDETSRPQPVRSWDRLGGNAGQPLSASAGQLTRPKSVSFDQLPAAVQSALRAEAGASQIQNIQQGRLNGQTVYQAAFNRNGRTLQVRVDPAGSILSTSQAQSSLGSVQP